MDNGADARALQRMDIGSDEGTTGMHGFHVEGDRHLCRRGPWEHGVCGTDRSVRKRLGRGHDGLREELTPGDDVTSAWITAADVSVTAPLDVEDVEHLGDAAHALSTRAEGCSCAWPI